MMSEKIKQSNSNEKIVLICPCELSQSEHSDPIVKMLKFINYHTILTTDLCETIINEAKEQQQANQQNSNKYYINLIAEMDGNNYSKKICEMIYNERKKNEPVEINVIYEKIIDIFTPIMKQKQIKTNNNEKIYAPPTL